MKTRILCTNLLKISEYFRVFNHLSPLVLKNQPINLIDKEEIALFRLRVKSSKNFLIGLLGQAKNLHEELKMFPLMKLHLDLI